MRLVLAGADDAEVLDRRATALQERIRGIKLRVDVAALPTLLQLPRQEWSWRQIGQSDAQGGR
ncbi:hypothetical protein ACGFNX_40315 [Streptomyces sp. NPDC048723]|uniref:hypothetical protein n=1 Tax=unclassified Streptomyces TaxID=2593676 RepID=UPI002E11B941|nr:hypothetical protein OG332_47360 [Streptomyces sp. NBC_01233]